MVLDYFRNAILVFSCLIFGFNIAVFMHVDDNTKKYWVYKFLLAGRNGILLAVIMAAGGNLLDWHSLTIAYCYNAIMLVSLIVCGVCLSVIYKRHDEVIIEDVGHSSHPNS